MPARIRPWLGRRWPGHLGAAALAVALLGSPARAEPASPLAVDMFFRVAGDYLAEVSPYREGQDDRDAAPQEMQIGGIPLRLGEGSVGDDWRSMTGVNGSYTLPITGRLTAVSRVRFARTDYVDDEAIDRSTASAGTEFRYVDGPWTLGVTPSLEIIRWDSSVMQQEPALEARISRALGGKLTLTGSAQYRLRSSTNPEPDREIAVGRTGFVYRLPAQINLDVGYVVRQETVRPQLASAQRDVIRRTGPSMLLAAPLAESLDLNLDYNLTDTIRSNATNQDTERQHQLGLRARWDVGGEIADIDMSAGYQLGRLESESGVETHHAGKMSLKLNF